MYDQDTLSGKVIGCAIEVHRHLGPGLLESTYQHCLSHELRLQGIEHQVEYPLPVVYKGTHLECGYRIGILVEKRLLLELKSVSAISEIHKAQILTYMKLSGVPLGLLLNFNVKILKEGIQRFKI